MDGFKILRCLWKRLDKPDSLVTITWGSGAPMVVKNNTKKVFYCFFYIFVFILEYLHTHWSDLTLQGVNRSVSTSRIHWYQ